MIGGVAAVALLAALVALTRRRASVRDVSIRWVALSVGCAALPTGHSDEIPRNRLAQWLPIVLAIVFVAIVASIGSSLLGLINSNVERLHTRFYQIDRDLDGFPDQKTSIMELDDAFLTLSRSNNAALCQTGVTLIAFIASAFYVIDSFLLSMPVGSNVSTSRWSSLWKYVFLIVSLSLLILLGSFAVIGLNPA